MQGLTIDYTFSALDYWSETNGDAFTCSVGTWTHAGIDVDVTGTTINISGATNSTGGL